MGRDPTSGGVRPVKSGKFKGTLRKRVGRYRTTPRMEFIGSVGFMEFVEFVEFIGFVGFVGFVGRAS
jgi:hypothetical protein